MDVRSSNTDPLPHPVTDELTPPVRLPRTGPLLLLVGVLGMGTALLLFPGHLVNLLGPLFIIVSLIGLYWTVITGAAWLLRRSRGRDGGART